MIRSFKSKRLKQFYERGLSSKLPPEMVERIRVILNYLDAMQIPQDIRFPSFHLHRLKGDRKDQWSISVTGNYRITFRFVDGGAEDVDFEEYH